MLVALLGVCSVPTQATENVALSSAGAVVITDSVYDQHYPELVIDGKWPAAHEPPQSNRWHANLDRPHPHWVWIRFRQPALVSRVVVHRGDLMDYPVDLVVEYSTNGGFSFQRLFTVSNNVMAASNTLIQASFDPVKTDNLRIRILRSSYQEHPNFAQLSEVEVFGDFIQPAAAKAPAPVANPRPSRRLATTKKPDMEISQTETEIEFRSQWLRLKLSREAPRITFLCWDSLGQGKTGENLLKRGPDGGAGAEIGSLFPLPNATAPSTKPVVAFDGNVVRYAQVSPSGVPLTVEVRVEPKSFRIAAEATPSQPVVARRPFAVNFAFDVARTPVAPFANLTPGASAPLPALMHAADYGTLAVRSRTRNPVVLTGEPVRSQSRWNSSFSAPTQARPSDGLVELSARKSQLDLEFTVTAVSPLEKLTRQEPRLNFLPRSWLNTFQYRPDIGILANNVVSDNAVFCMFTFTDPAVFTPTMPGGVEAIHLVRESLDRYFCGAAGYGVGLEDTITDTCPSLIIAAWDVIHVTGDRQLLRRWLPTLERLAERIIGQDHNGNGLPESSRSGLPGTAVCPTGNWWDQVNFGHEDAYVSALSFRAFGCMSDLERLAGQSSPAKRFQAQAEKIRAAYVPTFLNPKTSILAGWKDKDGSLHDYWFVFINGMAICYGLAPEALASRIIDRFEEKFRQVGFTRFDLGLPGNLEPIAQADYGKGALGSPGRADGADTFGVFENGGASACYAYFYVQALYKLGRRAEAERILWPMLERFAAGGFQNGVGKGGEWRRWDASPSGYEGFLADAYYAQLALVNGHYGIGFDAEGFHLEPWSPLKGERVPLELRFMGKKVREVR